MRRTTLLLGLLLAFCALAEAQTTPCKPTRQVFNRSGNKQDMTVGATAVQVLPEDSARCEAHVRNNGAAAARCLPQSQGAPTATNGYLLAAGDQIKMTTAGREALLCIRTTGTDTTFTTIEELP